MNGEKRNAYRILVGELKGKRPLGRLKHREVDKIKMDLKRELGGMNWNVMSPEGAVTSEGAHDSSLSNAIYKQFAAFLFSF
jgi:hypothetical protein